MAASSRAGSVCSMESMPGLSRASSRNMERDWENGSITSSITSVEYSGEETCNKGFRLNCIGFLVFLYLITLLLSCTIFRCLVWHTIKYTDCYLPFFLLRSYHHHFMEKKMDSTFNFHWECIFFPNYLDTLEKYVFVNRLIYFLIFTRS